MSALPPIARSNPKAQGHAEFRLECGGSNQRMKLCQRRYTSSTGWLSQPTGARLFERHYSPVLVAVAMRHRADEAITQDVAARQRHADCSACGERKLSIFQA